MKLAMKFALLGAALMGCAGMMARQNRVVEEWERTRRTTSIAPTDTRSAWATTATKARTSSARTTGTASSTSPTGISDGARRREQPPSVAAVRGNVV